MITVTLDAFINRSKCSQPQTKANVSRSVWLYRVSTSDRDSDTRSGPIFSLFGYLKVVKSDNGPPFNGTKWAEYMKGCGVKHRKIMLLWPQAKFNAINEGD